MQSDGSGFVRNSQQQSQQQQQQQQQRNHSMVMSSSPPERQHVYSRYECYAGTSNMPVSGNIHEPGTVSYYHAPAQNHNQYYHHKHNKQAIPEHNKPQQLVPPIPNSRNGSNSNQQHISAQLIGESQSSTKYSANMHTSAKQHVHEGMQNSNAPVIPTTIPSSSVPVTIAMSTSIPGNSSTSPKQSTDNRAPEQKGGSGKKDEKGNGAPVRKRLSLACTTCRQRKVKCDGGRPSCRTCAKFNWPCIYQPSNRKRGPRPRALALADNNMGFSARTPWSIAHGYSYSSFPTQHMQMPPYVSHDVRVASMHQPGAYNYDNFSSYGDYVASAGAIRIQPPRAPVSPEHIYPQVAQTPVSPPPFQSPAAYHHGASSLSPTVLGSGTRFSRSFRTAADPYPSTSPRHDSQPRYALSPGAEFKPGASSQPYPIYTPAAPGIGFGIPENMPQAVSSSPISAATTAMAPRQQQQQQQQHSYMQPAMGAGNIVNSEREANVHHMPPPLPSQQHMSEICSVREEVIPASTAPIPIPDTRPRLPSLHEALGSDYKKGASTGGSYPPPTVRRDSFREEVSKMLATDTSRTPPVTRESANVTSMCSNSDRVRLPPISALDSLRIAGGASNCAKPNSGYLNQPH